MGHSFLSQKGSGMGRGVKEKNLNRNKTKNALGIGVSMKSDDTMNEDTPFVFGGDAVGYGCDLIEYFMIMVVIVLLSLVSVASYVLVLPVFTLYCQRKLALFEFKDEFLCYWISAIKEERNTARGRFNTAGLFVYKSSKSNVNTVHWEVYSEDTRRYWKIIRVGNHTEAYQIFAEMLKKFDKEDLVKLWGLVKKRFSTTEPINDKEKELWVELKRLFEPDEDDTLWKLQRYMHDPLIWRFYDTCGVHHVSSVRGHDVFMLVEKDYPLTRGTLGLMMVARLLVEADRINIASAVKEGVTPSVVDITVEMEKQSSMENTTIPGSFPPLSMLVTSSAGNAPGKSSYVNVTSKPSEKKLNIRTLFTPGGNGIDVVVLMESIRAISERFDNTAYGFFLWKRVAYPVVANYVRILGKWHSNENLLKEYVSTVLVWVKLHGVLVTAFREDGLSAIATKLGNPLMLDSYTSDMCMQSWGRSSYAKVMIELQADVELKDNIVVVMPKITWEGHYICNVRVEYEWKPPRCASCKVFGHIHEECSKNTGAGEKKPVKKPSTNEGTTNLVNNGSSSSGPSFMNVDNSSTGTTPIIDKIRKFKELLTSGQAILMDEAGNPLKKVEFLGDYDSEDDVASVDNDMARSMASERVGFGTQSLLEQWRDSYGNGDYDDDPYDDDMYEGQDLSQKLQAIYDNLDI
ncbi:retrotransposon protein, putative, ty1-copia subclass [Tanacetum coccineum]